MLPGLSDPFWAGLLAKMLATAAIVVAGSRPPVKTDAVSPWADTARVISAQNGSLAPRPFSFASFFKSSIVMGSYLQAFRVVR